MSTRKESIWVILSGIAGLVYVLYTFWPSLFPSPPLRADGAQPQPRDHPQVVEVASTKDTNAAKDTKESVEAESAGYEPKRQEPSPQTPNLRLPRPDKAASGMPAEFTLNDGEQKVLLSGQASIGIRFNQIGEEQFLTLRINSSEGSENHAVLGTGGRFRFQHDGSEYYVTVLRFDHTARTAALRVDRVAQDR